MEPRRGRGLGREVEPMEEPQQPAEEAEAAGGRLALRFQRAFLAGRRLAEFPWQDLEEILKDSGDSSSLLAILQKTVLHPLCSKYPPSVKYRRCFLSELIKKHESVGAEPLDELYEALRDVLTAEESTHCYKNYLLPSGDAITLCESVAIISRGTTGLVTWDAGLYLAEWAFENSEVFGNRNILELGSGIGLTGITICKTSFPQGYTFSDHHQCVLQQLSENIRLNGFLLEPEAGRHGALEWKNQKVELAGVQAPNITVAELDWNCVTATQLSAFRADVVIAADVVYDPELTQSFIAVLRKLSTCKNNEKLPDVYIAFTIRNPDTYRHFQNELDKFGIRWQVVPGPQKNLFPYDRHATITILKLLV